MEKIVEEKIRERKDKEKGKKGRKEREVSSQNIV